MFPRQPIDYSSRLPKHWDANVAVFDRQWIGRTVFSSKGTLATPLRLWYHPPADETATNVKPDPRKYFARKLLLWFPRRLFSFDFKCSCKKSVRSKGVYNRVRLVLDIESYYYMVTEYMHCTCGKTYAAWDKCMLDQLPYALRVKFPAVLTHKYTCDVCCITVKVENVGEQPNSYAEYPF